MENKASVKLTGDSSSLNAATNRSENALEDLKDTFDDVKKSAALYDRQGRLITDTSIRMAEAASLNKKALAESGKVVEKLGISAKQTAAAIRGVPAQFTDIVTSLQGGQAPLTVLLQQGGQLKDMFGGVGNAARALSGYVIGLINPFTLTAAAAGTLGAAYYYVTQDNNRFQNALITSGNIVGQTSGQLETLADTVGATTGHYTQSREAVEALAASGVVSGDQLESALKGVLAMSELTGKSVADLVPKFEEIARNPVKAIVKLNEQYNFLTLDVYKQIKALEEQGKTTEAAKLATETFADALEGRKDQLLENLGAVERGWLKIKSAIDGAKNAIFDIDRPLSLDEQVEKAQNKLRYLSNNGKAGYVNGDAKTRDEYTADVTQAANELNDLLRQRNTAKFLADDAAKYMQDQKEKIAKAEEASSSKTKKTTNPLNSDRESLGQLQRENELLAQGFSLQESQTIAKLEAKGANQALIVSILDANEAQANYVEAMKAADDAEKSKLKALQDEKEATEKRAYEQEQAAAKLKKQKEETFDSLNDQYLKANQELDADLITSDIKREKRRAEIAHEYALKRIEDEKLSAEQTAALIEQEAENYEKTLKKIENEANKTKNLGAELGLTFASTFEDSIVKGGSFGDLISSLGQDIERVITRMLVIEPLIRNIKSAVDDAGGSGGIFGAIGSFFGGDSNAGSSQSYVDGIPVGDVFSALGYHSGGIAGLNPTFKRGVNSSLFNNAPRFHTGGVAGDEVPAILRKGEGVFTQEQMRNLSPAGGGNVQVNLIEAPNSAKAGSVETSQDGNNKTLNIFIEKIKASIANDISRGTGISSALEQTYALNRAAGAR